ncbi:MAG: hypothetical protein V4616_08900 [Bacteroidota bacterium]
MKTTFLTLVLAAGFAVSGFAQKMIKEKNVPDHISSAVHKKYPSATDIKWEDNGPDFKAEFKSNKMDHKLWITSTGVIVKAKEDITNEMIPSNIQQKIANDFTGMTIDEAEKLEINSRVYYVVELTGQPGGDRKVTFNPDGTVENNILD